MSDWRPLIRAALAGDAAMVLLVAGRIYAEQAPPNCPTPFVTITDVSQVALLSHNGDANFDEQMIQVSAWSSTQDGARQIRDAIRSALQGLAPGTPILGTLNVTSLRVMHDATSNLHSAMADFRFYVDSSSS